MSKKKKTVPTLRFPGFTEEWEVRKLSDEATFSKGRGYSKTDLTEEGTPIILYGRLYTRYQTTITDIDTFVTKKPNSVYSNGNEVIVPASGETAEDIARASSIEKTGVLIGGDLNIIYPNKNIVPEFLALSISNGRQQKTLAKKAQGKSVVHLRNSNLMELELILPEKKEQTQIGTFFKNLDNLITLHQRKIEHLQEQKKGLLQKMFPKKDQQFPELRFPGFTDAWEQRKLSDLTEYKNGKGHEDKQSLSGKYELVNLNSISINGGLKHSGKFVDDTSDTLFESDLVMVLSDVGHGDLLGRVALIPENDRFVLNQRVALLRPNRAADPQFLFSYINAHQRYFKAQGAGMSQLNISKGSVESFTSLIPGKEEQVKIGKLFKSLDNLITLHQRKLNHLQDQKKALLQQLFI